MYGIPLDAEAVSVIVTQVVAPFLKVNVSVSVWQVGQSVEVAAGAVSE